jgi:hypothetical protein
MTIEELRQALDAIALDPLAPIEVAGDGFFVGKHECAGCGEVKRDVRFYASTRGPATIVERVGAKVVIRFDG